LVLLTEKLLQAVAKYMSTSANQNITANHLVFTDNDFSYNLKENEVNILFVNVFNTFEKFGFV
jgi:hypothetical protein